MNPIDLVFSSISQMTGGYITDMQTLVVCLLGFEFLLFGFEELSDFITNSFAKGRAFNGMVSSDSDVRTAYKNMAYHRGIAWTSDHDQKLNIKLSEVRATNALKRYADADDEFHSFGGVHLTPSNANKRDLATRDSLDDWF